MDLDLAFQILEIKKSADKNEIRTAYRDLVQIWHPDKYIHNRRLSEKAVAKMKDINCAYALIQEYFGNNKPSSKVKPANESKKEETNDFIDCINCGLIYRVSKNTPNATLKCGRCGKNPYVKETRCKSQTKSTEGTESLKKNDTRASSNNDSKNRKNIQILRPAFIASLIWFIFGFSYARPPGYSSDGAKGLALCLMIGITYSLLAFVIVAIWQGLRRFFSKPSDSLSPKKFKSRFFAPIRSTEEALTVIKDNCWVIFILTALSSIFAIYIGNVGGGLLDVVLVGGLSLIVYHRKSRIAAICLVILSLVSLIVTGHNRFFGGEGGQNMISAFFMLWASFHLVVATIRLKSFGESVEYNTEKSPPSGKTNKWNYVGIGTGVFMLLFLFLPQITSGTLANQYYLGAVFWVLVIIYSSLNILRARK